MKRRNVISTLIAEQLAAANSGAGGETPPTADAGGQRRIAAGPVRTMGLTLDTLELERKSLEHALATGGAILELDPALVEGSFAADRFESEGDAAFEALKQSIADSGQEVPILVRPLPDRPGRYQVAYGHRRLRACRALGRPVRAFIRPLTDRDLVIAQGLENASRVDLSFIERASFARGLEDRGFDRGTVMAALGTDKTELSKLISTRRALPDRLVAAIGAAPRAGRRRWMQLADLLRTPGALERALALAAEPGFGVKDSDSRFLAVLAAASRAPAEAAEKAPFRMDIRGAGGEVLARIRETPEALSLVIDRAHHLAFADFLVRELPDIYDRFRAAEEPTPAGRG